MFKIEKGIPLPSHATRKIDWGFMDQMEVGDSFLVPDRKQSSFGHHYTVWRKMFPNKGFTARQEGKNVRIWRVK